MKSTAERATRTKGRAEKVDFFPVLGIDHVEIYVGNAKQAAHFYERGFGFLRRAYSGLETGARDRASYVLEQGKIHLRTRSDKRAITTLGSSA